MGFWTDKRPITMGTYRHAATLIAFLSFLCGFLVGSTCDTANAADMPQYADLTFTDIADLDARVDSVLGVCDTLWCDGMRYHNQFPRDTLWIAGSMRHGLIQVTCRRFAGVTVYVMPVKLEGAKCIPCPIEPGKARIWWWEVKQ